MIKLLILVFIFFSLNSYAENRDTDSLANSADDSTDTTSNATHVKGGTLTGGRSKASIMRVVMQSLTPLKNAYNKQLSQKNGMYGTITTKFAIDEFGEIIYCAVVSSTVNDSVFEKEIVQLISKWKFEKIHKPGDVTEVVYPFVFSTYQTALDVQALDIDKNKKGTRDSKRILKIINRNKYKLNRIQSANFSNASGELKITFIVDCYGKVINSYTGICPISRKS